MVRVAEQTRHDRRNGTARAGSTQSFVGLLGFIAAGAALGGLLWQLAGPPEIPAGLPNWRELRDVLTGSRLADEDVVGGVRDIGWLTLAYLGVTIVLRVLCELAVRAADGAAWARAALRISDLITLPPVRRMVNGAVAGVLVVTVWSRAGSAAVVEGSVVTAVVAPEPRGYAGAEHSRIASLETANGDFNAPASGSEAVSYTVAEGDTLWNIARRFYGDGSLYISIFEANTGRTMLTGETFTNPSVIRPGWVLEVPMRAQNIQPEGDRMMYRVRNGDSLWRIAESLLGDGLRWTEVWELNKGRDMGGGRGFTDPGQVFPGWVLELPVAASPRGAAPTVEPTAAPTPGPSPGPTAVATTEQPNSTVSPGRTPFPLPESPSGRGGTFEWPSPSLGGSVLAAAAGIGGIGGLALIVRELRRRSGRPRAAMVRHNHSTGDAGRVDLAARSLLQALHELGFEDVGLLLVRESERFLDFRLDCAPGDADALVRSRFDIGRRLACAADAEGLSSTRVQLKLSRFQRLAGMLLDRASAAPVVLLVPVGAAQNGIHYLNLAAAGSVLLTGSRTETSQMTSSWVSSLGTLHPPEQLAFLAAGAGQEKGAVPGPDVAAMPGDEGSRSIEQLAGVLEEAIVSREASVEGAATPSIVSFADLAEQGAEDLTRLDTVIHRGPEHGIFIVCVTHHPVDVPNMFGARVTFGRDEDEPDGLTLTAGRDAPLALMPVAVRAQRLRRHAEPAGWPTAEADVPDPSDEAAVLAQADAEPAVVRHDGPVEDPAAASPAVLPALGVESPVADRRGGGQWSQRGASAVAVASPIDEMMAPVSPPVVAEVDVQSAAGPRLLNGGSEHGSRQAVLLVTEDAAPAVEAAAVAPPTFAVRCFGTFQVMAGGDEVNGWTIQKARELLAYLIARGGARVSRDDAAEALWPDELPDRVGHLLSNAAYYVRRTLNAATPNPDGRLLTVAEQCYQLKSGVFRVDLDAFDAHLRRAETLQGSDALTEYGRALAIYKGDFLGNEPYEWADPYRRDYQRRFVAAAHQAGRLALDCRDVKKAMEFYRAVLDRDPIDEEAARALMRCHGKIGDLNSARKVYKALRESLRRELDDENAEPLPETSGLLQELTG